LQLPLEPPLLWIRRWPKGFRLGMAWTSVVLTVLVGIPAAITGCFLLFQFDQCSAVFGSGAFRALAAIATVAILLPIVLFWMRFLQRIVSYRDANDVTDESD
jgi:ABC-type phosphate transport system permease subunit